MPTQDELKHYGVPGMRWGKRKASSSAPTADLRQRHDRDLRIGGVLVMIKSDFKSGGYKLSAEDGQDLITLSDEVEIARCKEIIIPPEGTLNEWIEVDALITPKLTEEELKQQRILELEKELELLKNS